MRASILPNLLRSGVLLLAGGCTPGHAADRGYSVTDFSRIRAEGPFDVTVRVGPPVAVRAHGTQDGLDRVSVEVDGDTLVIHPDHSAWSGWPGAATGAVTLEVTVPLLRAVAIVGSGDVTIDRVRGAELQLSISGSGDLAVGDLAVDRLDVAVVGSGTATLAGRAKQADVAVRGSGDLVATPLTVDDATLSATGSGDLAITALRSAKVGGAGSGDVTVAGPAACTIDHVGSGDVACAHRVE